MPGQIKSQAQFRFMQAAAHGGATKADLPPSTAKKMLKDNPVNYKELPKKKMKK